VPNLSMGSNLTHSGKILESLTQEEIDSRVRDLLSRKTD